MTKLATAGIDYPNRLPYVSLKFYSVTHLKMNDDSTDEGTEALSVAVPDAAVPDAAVSDVAIPDAPVADLGVANTAVAGTTVMSKDAADVTYYGRQEVSKVGAAVPAAISNEDCVDNEVIAGRVLTSAMNFSRTSASAVRLQSVALEEELKQLQLRAEILRLQQEIKNLKKKLANM